MPGREVLLCLLFCPAVLTNMFLWSAVHHLFGLGKSKTRIKKEKKAIPKFRKWLLIGYAERCERHASTAKRLCYIFWGYALTTAVCVALWLLSAVLPGAEGVFSVCVLAKVVVFDIPVGIFGFVMTKRRKPGGGVTWKWT